jgi:hypothetical protein
VDDAARQQVALMLGQQAIQIAEYAVEVRKLRDDLEQQTERSMLLEAEVADLRATLARDEQSE